MKPIRIFSIISILLISISLSACKNSPFKQYQQETPQQQSLSPINSSDDAVVIQKIKNNPGISSVTVERLAIQDQCMPSETVSRLTPAGPVEVYRATCTDGRIFMARCELRQCKAMPSKE